MTYVIRSSGKKEEFDGEKLISSIMAAANDAGLMNEAGIQDIIKNIGSNTISYAQDQEEVPTKTLKDAILAQVLEMGIRMAIQKFGANASKDNILDELISAGLQMSNKGSRTTQSDDILSQLLGVLMKTDSSTTAQSNDILSQLLGTGTNSRTTQSDDILSQLLGAGLQMPSKSSKTSSSNDNLESILKTGMKLANAWMQYNK